MDHPRSRGVYHSGTGPGRAQFGSSPLARGLLVMAWDETAKKGIIPARAGFTAVVLRPLLITTDHPRSRGVYPSDHTFFIDPAGSSPLARGLPEGFGKEVDGKGIIPARAGFTTPRTSR